MTTYSLCIQIHPPVQYTLRYEIRNVFSRCAGVTVALVHTVSYVHAAWAFDRLQPAVSGDAEHGAWSF